MEVEYIFRPRSGAVSIEKVFGSVIEEMQKMPDVTVYRSEVKKFAWWPLTMLYNIVRYAVKSYRYDRIFHITGDIQYVGCLMNSKRTVITVHDLVPFHNPNVPWYAKFIAHWMSFYFPLKHLNKVTCISDATKNDLISFFPWVAGKITVINNPVSSTFRYSPKALNLNCPRILHLGTRTNKNLERVVEALCDIPCHLRIIGKLSDKQTYCLMKFKIDYSNVYDLTDEEIVQEYVDSDIVSFPSLFEGFGMPIIEGQAVGRLVVTSDIEPMASIAGSGAVLVNPKSITSIKKAYEQLIADKFLCDCIINDGLKNVNRYLSSKIANKYACLYRQL